MVVDFDHFVAGIYLVENERQVRIVGILPGGVVDRGAVFIGLIKALLEGERIAQGGDAAADGAFADRNEKVAMFAELNQVADIFLIATTAFDQSDRATPGEFLKIIDRRLVEIDKFDQIENAFVDVEDRHVTTETTGQGSRGDFGFGSHKVLSG